MYQIGDKIVYPMHGAGVIEAIEEKDVLGKKQLYYVTRIKDMQVMFPMGSKIGIRHVVDLDTLEDVLTSFSFEPEDQILNPSQRYRSNMDKIKTGNVFKGAQVVRDLISLSKTRTLSASDKTVLDNARQILISELMLVKGIDEEQATDLLEEVISG